MAGRVWVHLGHHGRGNRLMRRPPIKVMLRPAMVRLHERKCNVSNTVSRDWVLPRSNVRQIMLSAGAVLLGIATYVLIGMALASAG